MPRYCAVKVCRNRRATAFKQDNKRISFYPFPLHDKARLQRWVINMARRGWTPGRHQYLCSDHFTDDCFDVRWGIRYLKNTAIPDIFPTEDDIAASKTKPQSLDKNAETDDFVSESRNGCGDGTFMPPLRSRAAIWCHSALEVTDDSRRPTSPHIQPLHKEHADSAVMELHRDRIRRLSENEADVNSSVLEAALSQALSMNPVVMVMDAPTDTEGSDYGSGEHVSVWEHSYSRPDTDTHQLWRKIFSLHAKILDLDHKEESTVAKINALETEISHLKRDNAICKEKQKILEGIMSSKLV